ncbi:hypothetical protein [Salibacterium aidingense]|uniref:hypothetical protein n=1 Tax=Salibacterium aidingense TaxID=384933 RepID=UPI003BEBAFB3
MAIAVNIVLFVLIVILVVLIFRTLRQFRMSRFNPGDRVVVTGNKSALTHYADSGSEGTVIEPDRIPPCAKVRFDSGFKQIIADEDLRKKEETE